MKCDFKDENIPYKVSCTLSSYINLGKRLGKPTFTIIFRENFTFTFRLQQTQNRPT